MQRQTHGFVTVSWCCSVWGEGCFPRLVRVRWCLFAMQMPIVRAGSVRAAAKSTQDAQFTLSTISVEQTNAHPATPGQRMGRRVCLQTFLWSVSLSLIFLVPWKGVQRRKLKLRLKQDQFKKEIFDFFHETELGYKEFDNIWWKVGFIFSHK